MNDTPLELIESAVARLIQKLAGISTELLPIQQTLGRVLAEPITADRDSPATHVSAMDGYAFKLADLKQVEGSLKSMQICAVACAGKPPVELKAGQAVQIFTGACVPEQADCIVPREETRESLGCFELLSSPDSLVCGQHIRRRGENTQAGLTILAAGTEITTATVGSLATFGPGLIPVRRILRVAILTSGDELIEPGEEVRPWQVRDSNGPTLRSWLSKFGWADLVYHARIKDDLANTKQVLASALDGSDVVFITGGVSAGDTDHIPRAIAELGAEIVFHRLPIRPGRPVLGACHGNKVIFGLPGNPVSTAITARVIAQPVLESLVAKLPSPTLTLPLLEPDNKSLSLVWYRLIQLSGAGCQLVGSNGSGDLVSMAVSHGFLQIPAGASGMGPWKTWLW